MHKIKISKLSTFRINTIQKRQLTEFLSQITSDRFRLRNHDFSSIDFQNRQLTKWRWRLYRIFNRCNIFYIVIRYNLTSIIIISFYKLASIILHIYSVIFLFLMLFYDITSDYAIVIYNYIYITDIILF